MVVSTHLDDAVFSCYSVLGPETTVVTVLAGMPPSGVLGNRDEEGGATGSRDRVIERRAEDARALASAGCAVVHLDLPDSQYWGELDPPTRLDVAAALSPHLETAETVYAPAGIHNPDHKLVRDGALAVRPGATFYADLPYARHPDLGGFRLPPEVAAADRRRREVRPDARTLAAKLEACRWYATQLRQLTETFGAFLGPESLGLEVFWLSVAGSAPPAQPDPCSASASASIRSSRV